MTAHKIYNTAPSGNTAADLENARYMNLAIKTLKEESARLKTATIGVQIMLAHIEILLLLANKFVEDARLSIKKQDVSDWKTTFYEWFERCKSKIPTKFRDGIKQSADVLFDELESFAR